MSNEIPLAFQVAVLGAGDRPIGSGLILDSEWVLTCAHVAAEATIGNKESEPRSDVDIKLRTIPWHGGDPLVARLSPEAWRGKAPTLGDRGLRDLVVLELATPMDGWSDHCAIYPGSSFPQDETPLFGFTKAQPDGVRTSVLIKGEVADGDRDRRGTECAISRARRVLRGPALRPRDAIGAWPRRGSRHGRGADRLPDPWPGDPRLLAIRPGPWRPRGKALRARV